MIGRRCGAAWLLIAPLLTTAHADAQSARHPTVQLGSVGEISLRGRLSGILRTAVPDEGQNADLDWRSRRIGVEGTLFKKIEFEVCRELGAVTEPECDAYVNVRMARAVQIQAGQFKIPFGHDALTSGANLDFVVRSLIGHELSPGRDVGVMTHGRLAHRTLSYEVGYFRRDGDNARTANTRGGTDAVAARVVVSPLASMSATGLASLQVGAAVVHSQLDDQLGLRGRTAFGEGVFFDRVFVNGSRLRRGFEAAWARGPVSLSSEYIDVSDERRGMGFEGESLPNVHAAGWYVAGTWLLTGERKQNRVEPGQPLFAGGFGAVELAARTERMTFDSIVYPGSGLGFPSAQSLSANGERVTTIGTTWYVNRYVKIQGDLVLEVVDDPQRSPAPRGNGRFASGLFLFQVAL
jgi:phosphate-selective porin OprO and OprP